MEEKIIMLCNLMSRFFLNALVFKLYTVVPCSSSGCLSGITWKSFLIVSKKSAADLRLKHQSRPIEFGIVESGITGHR